MSIDIHQGLDPVSYNNSTWDFFKKGEHYFDIFNGCTHLHTHKSTQNSHSREPRQQCEP